MNDLRFAFRQLLKNPGFTAVAVLMLGLGIGVNTAIFNLGRGLLVRPVPGVEQPERLVQIGATRNGDGFRSHSYPDFQDFKAPVPALDMAALYDGPVQVGAGTSDLVLTIVAGGLGMVLTAWASSLAVVLLPPSLEPGTLQLSPGTQSLVVRQTGRLMLLGISRQLPAADRQPVFP